MYGRRCLWNVNTSKSPALWIKPCYVSPEGMASKKTRKTRRKKRKTAQRRQKRAENRKKQTG